MVDQPEYGTNCPYYVDIIEFYTKTKHINCDRIIDLYLKNHHSAAQIAKQFGTVKSVILSILHQAGVHLETGKGRLTNPENYRHYNPPYGYAVRNGKLVINKAELKICRVVVDLIGRQGTNTSRASKELMRRGFKNRAGNVHWDHKTVKLIFKRWRDKI